jgi:hypothetical protein
VERVKVHALLTLRRICSKYNHGQPNLLYLKSALAFGVSRLDSENGGKI